ncbi:MAG: protein phosphatase 2C domain-containing protein [Anaerolineaceae bacterium]|nr:protein phosphatase 2C domain-containing protein [Anaerolineaceae bacterium]
MREFLEFNFDAKSHMGRKLDHDEDYVAFHIPAREEERNEQGCLFVVADGVGGAEAGEFASQYAAEKVIYEYYRRSSLPIRERLITSIQQANRDIFTHALDNAPDGGMGTTVVAALLIKNQLYVANVGDSRAYLLTGSAIKQISQDHNLVGEIVAQGVMTEEAARQMHTKNQLTRCIGSELDVTVDLFGPIAINKGERVLLCTDGLTRYTTQGDLVSLAGSGKLADNVIRMVSFAIENGGEDNVSMILIEAVDRSTTTLKSPIKHVGRRNIYRLPFSTSGPSTPGKMPDLQPPAVIRGRRRIAPWLMITGVVAGLLLIAGFVWNATRAVPAATIDLTLPALTAQTTLEPTALPTSTVIEPTPFNQSVYLPGDIRSISISPNGELMAVATIENGINLIRLKNWSVFHNIPTTGVTGIVFTDNGTILSASIDGYIQAWGGAGWKELSSNQVDTTGIRLVIYSAAADLMGTVSDGSTIVLWSPIKDPGSINIIGFTRLVELANDSPVNSMAFSPNGKFLLAGLSDGTTMEWNLVDYQGASVLTKFPSPVTAVVYSGDGKCLAAGSMVGAIRSVCRNEGVIGGENLIANHDDVITSLAFSSASSGMLASGSADQTIKVWRNFYELVLDIAHGSNIERLIFTPDAKYLVAAWSNNGVNTLSLYALPYQEDSKPTVLPVLTATATLKPVEVPGPEQPTLIPP